MTPCLSKKGEIGTIHFFTELKRTPSPAFSPEVFCDFAPIILNTDNAVKLDDITNRIATVNQWKKDNPEIILLNAVDKAKSNPVKTKPSTAAPQGMEAETNEIVSLPHADNQEESQSFNEEDSDEVYDRETLSDILAFDWEHFNFQVPSHSYRKFKGGPTKVEHYRDLMEKCHVRDWFFWMCEQGDELKNKSTPNVDLDQLKEKLSSWTVSLTRQKCVRNG